MTEDLVTELTKHETRVCPIECKSGETLKGETCVECSEKRVWVVRGTDGKLTSHPVPETVLSKFR